MGKKVIFKFDEETEAYVAGFYNGETLKDFHVLTQTEVDGLLDVVNFSKLPATYTADYLSQETNSTLFDNNEIMTPFETILENLTLY